MEFCIGNTNFERALDYSDIIAIPSYNKDYYIHYSHDDLSTILSKVYLPGDFIFMDENVYKLYGNAIDSISPTHYLIFNATENTKTMEYVLTIVNRMIQINLTKKNKLIVIGGGITQDVGGFAATIYKRGIEWILIPTTLLSMADSAIGGKVCINHGYKNILSLFNAPNDIYLSDVWLSSLSEIDLYSGLGEIYKLCLIGGENSHRICSEYIQNIPECDRGIYQDIPALLNLIKIASCIKKIIIVCDEFDKNERKSLNYGHTFGHAIEKSTQYQIPHGIAVSYGMYIINRLFHGDTSVFDEVNNTIQKLVPQSLIRKPLFLHDFLECITNDKKNDGEHICFIVLDKIGQVTYIYRTLKEIYDPLLEILQSLFAVVT